MADAVNKASDAASTVAGTATDATSKVVDTVVNININKVQPFVYWATCCQSTSFGLNYPECIGCATEGIVCCCISVKSDAFKPSTDSNVLCIFESSSIACIKPGKTLCNARSQTFCIENRFALPCDAESPCMCTICFVELFRSNEFTTDIKPKIVVLPRIDSLNFSAPSAPAIARH